MEHTNADEVMNREDPGDAAARKFFGIFFIGDQPKSFRLDREMRSLSEGNGPVYLKETNFPVDSSFELGDIPKDAFLPWKPVVWSNGKRSFVNLEGNKNTFGYNFGMVGLRYALQFAVELANGQFQTYYPHFDTESGALMRADRLMFDKKQYNQLMHVANPSSLSVTMGKIGAFLKGK